MEVVLASSMKKEFVISVGSPMRGSSDDAEVDSVG